MNKILTYLFLFSVLCGTAQAAFPTTISGVTFLPTQSQGRSRPYISSAGNVYFVFRDGSTNTDLDVFKATDPTTSFSQTATLTLTGSAVLHGVGSIQDGDNIHIATQDDGDKLLYHVFSMSSDSFTTSNEAVTSAIGTNVNAEKAISIELETGGDIIIFYQGASENVQGQKERVNTAYKVGGSWTVDQAVDDGGAVNYFLGGIVRGGGVNKFHLVYKDDTNSDALHKSVQDVDGTLSSVETMNDTSLNAVDFAVVQPVYYDTSGIERITAIWGAGSTTRTGVIEDDGIPEPEKIMSSLVRTNSEFLVVSQSVDDLTIHIFITDTEDDLFTAFSEDDALFWLSGGEELDAVEIRFITSNVYQRGSDIVLAYVYDDAGAIKYNEKILRSVVEGSTQGARGARTGFTF